MSTRSSIYYEEGGVHIFQDFMDGIYMECGRPLRLRLEYCQDAFTVNILLSQRLSEIILAGLRVDAK